MNHPLSNDNPQLAPQPEGEVQAASEAATGDILQPTATIQPLDGCTLAQYAAITQLPEPFLDKFRLADEQVAGKARVTIPYGDVNGNLIKHGRHCTGVDASGDLVITSPKGTKARSYGEHLLRRARQQQTVALVAAEPDVHTLLYHGQSALAIPRSTSWTDDYDSLLAGIPTIHVVAAPGGDEAVLEWLGQSAHRECMRVITLGEYAGPSALHRAVQGDATRFQDHWTAALEAARSLDTVERAVHEARQAALWEKCAELGLAPRILDRVVQALAASGVVGEEQLAKLVYLIATSRRLDRPVSGVIKGPSSAGKSFVSERVLQLFPSSAYYALTGMSPKALAYDEEPLKHRLLVIYEAAGVQGDWAQYLLRSLLSEGRVRYQTVISTKDGPRPLLVEREGPTGLLMTTTRIELHEENETRYISIPATDTREQTRNVLRALAAARTGVAGANHQELDLAPWHTLQSWLDGAEHRVDVPFGPTLADLIPPVATRLRRDFGTVLSLIQAHALLRQATRERNAEGWIIASLDDYTAVHELVADLVADRVEAAVPVPVRETVAAVSKLLAERGHQDPFIIDLTATDADPPGVTVTAVARELQLDKSTALRRVEVAIEHGYLRDMETRRGRPRCLVLGEPMPEEMEILPSPEKLAEHL
jgi:hypothetical protein